MLKDKNAAASLAVRDINRARQFYENTLGLTPVDSEGPEFVTYKSGGSTINVYRSDYAGTNKATALTWVVGNELDTIIKSLKDKGVPFEHYNMPGMKLQGDVHVGDDNLRVAWFKDPDGNILNLASG